MAPGVHNAVITSLWLASLAVSGDVAAQIYQCTGPDNTTVFSDKRCGPDAKVVKGIATRKSKASAARTAKVEPKSAAELDALLKRCNDGDNAACMTWTNGGGPNRLRSQEKEQEASCDAGSLTACEQRYCRDGGTQECRSRVMQLATVSGDSWYLRFQQKLSADAPAVYTVRCLNEGRREIRDITIECKAVAGPDRCRSGQGDAAYPKLDEAASGICSMAASNR